ncbi:hypothetical protein [Flavobacterium franklandianum]|uniref:Uncharacterized protein n=1 Tax=Flavobacterium franklandianum TaxID=2594430 RepID=A0A553CJS6_9FLAO|nr:hypothetical protein [Flavobacterium franklandianum]TRX20754.1 hypothetical protein FNW17_10265 [Flavobacterium franklandianum]
MSYRQDYFDGYSNGQNPFLQIDCKKSSVAYISGFNSGRMDYEEMNEQISKGIPQRIVTIKVLEEFLLAGLLGLSIEDADNYSLFQLNIIAKWYQSGIEKYDPSHSTYLFDFLEDNGIHVD